LETKIRKYRIDDVITVVIVFKEKRNQLIFLKKSTSSLTKEFLSSISLKEVYSFLVKEYSSLTFSKRIFSGNASLLKPYILSDLLKFLE